MCPGGSQFVCGKQQIFVCGSGVIRSILFADGLLAIADMGLRAVNVALRHYDKVRMSLHLF